MTLRAGLLVALGLLMAAQPVLANEARVDRTVQTSGPSTGQIVEYVQGPSGLTGVPVEQLSTTGGTPAVTLLPGTVKGVPADLMSMLPPGASQLRTITSRFGDLAVSVLDFAPAGVTPAALSSCAVSAGSAFQAASDYVVSQGGGKVIVPKGFYCLGPTETVIIRGPVFWQGEGRGSNSGTGYFGGTLVRTSNPTGDVFTVQSRGAVKFSDFAIDASIVKTAGSAISLAGDSTNPENNGSEITGMVFGANLRDDIRVTDAWNWQIHANYLQDYLHDGIWLSGEGGTNPDGSTGQATISDNVIFAFNTAATANAAIDYNCGGDIQIVGNKLIGGAFNILLSLTRLNTGTIVVTANSMEEANINNFRAQRGTGVSGQFADITFTGNQVSILATGGASSTFQGGFATVASTNPTTHAAEEWLLNVAATGNVWNMALAKSTAVVTIQAGRGVVFGHNTISNLGVSGAWAFDVGGTSSKVLLDENEVHDTPTGIYNTVTGSAVVHDTINGADPASGAGLIFNQLGSFGNGSELYIKDGACTSGTLAGSGTGSFARRIAGAWKC